VNGIVIMGFFDFLGVVFKKLIFAAGGVLAIVLGIYIACYGATGLIINPIMGVIGLIVIIIGFAMILYAKQLEEYGNY